MTLTGSSAFGEPRNFSSDDSAKVAQTYLRALQARDSRTAYSHISQRDRAVRSESEYIRSRETFDGFASRLARWFAAEMRFWAIENKMDGQTTRIGIGYKLPAGDEIAEQLLDWNPRKLNALSKIEQQRLWETLEALKRSGQMVMIEGQESLEMVREKDGWKVYLNWPSRARVIFRSKGSRALAVRFLRNDFLAAKNEPFQVDFALTNPGTRPIAVKLNHLIDPPSLADNVEMIACGLLSPFVIQPGETREFASSYIVAGLSPGTRITINYDFEVKAPSTRGDVR